MLFARLLNCLLPAAVLFSSAPPVHPSFSQDSILLNPVVLSGLDHKGVPASNFLKWQEVEVCQIMPRQVEVLSHPCIEVVSYCPSVLCTSNSAGAGGAHFAHILGWSSQALACLVGAGDVVDDIGVLAGDALLHWPRLSSQGARVCICVG